MPSIVTVAEDGTTRLCDGGFLVLPSVNFVAREVEFIRAGTNMANIVLITALTFLASRLYCSRYGAWLGGNSVEYVNQTISQ